MFLIFIGFLAGIIGGMGMGGGTILIPALVIFANVKPHIAQSVNLLSSIPMSLFALIIHMRNKNVRLDFIIPLATFGVAGAIFGSIVANYLNSETLKRLFGVFLLAVGIYEIKKGLSHD